METEELKWHFLRGYVDGDGSIYTTKKSEQPGCNITSDSKEILVQIKEFSNTNCFITKNKLVWSGQYAVDFLNKLYKNKQDLYLERKYEKYTQFKHWFPYQSKEYISLKYKRLILDAPKPKKQNNIKDKNIWYLYLIKKIK